MTWIAIVRQDDSIEVIGELFNNHHRENHGCVLKDGRQIGVTCLQWRPHCYAMLAVDMETGLSLWNADPSMMQSRLASSLLRYDQYPGHSTNIVSYGRLQVQNKVLTTRPA